MLGDSESSILKGMSQLEKRMNELEVLYVENKSLKNRLTRMSNRIKTVDIAGFQEQLNATNDMIQKISHELARFEIDFLRLHMANAVENHSIVLERSGRYKRVRSKIDMFLTHSEGMLENAINPINVAVEARLECVKISEEYNLGAFIT